MALEIRKAHIHDAKALTRLRLLSGNITAAENELREFSESSDCKYKVVTDGEKILSLVLIRRSRLAHNAEITSFLKWINPTALFEKMRIVFIVYRAEKSRHSLPPHS